MAVATRTPEPSRTSLDAEDGPGLRWPFPVLRSLDGYRRSWLSKDLTAGLLIVAIAIPLSMGMAEVAGMPPIAGLYSCVLPLIAYAVIGSSRQLVVALDASTAAMLAAAVAPLAGGDPLRYAALAGITAVLVGVVLVAAGALRLGFLANLLSEPVLLGYQAGLALTVTATQLPKLMGITLEEERTFLQFVEMIRRAAETNVPTLFVGVGVLASVLLLRRWRPTFPGALVAVVAATLVVEVLDLAARGVSVLGDLPSGLPSLHVPDAGWTDVLELLPSAAAIALIAAADTIVSSRAFAHRGGYEVSANRDLVGLGAANLSSGLSGGITTSASAARTAVAESVGSRSQVAGLVAAFLMVAVLLLFTRPLQNVPNAALAAVVISAVIRLIEVDELARLWRIRRMEFLVAAATTVGAVVIGLLEGILIAVALSVLDFVRRAARPHDAIEGRIRGRHGFFDTARYPDASTEPGFVLYRFDAPLFYANTERFFERARELIDATPDAEWFVVDTATISDIDATAARMLKEVHDELAARGIRLVLVELLASLEELLGRAGVLDVIGPDRVFDTAEEALIAYREERANRP